MQAEVEGFLKDIASEEGKPTSLAGSLNLSFSNVICSLLMSVRFEKEDPRYKRFVELIEEGFQLCTSTGASNFIPCLKNLPRLQALTLKIQAVSLPHSWGIQGKGL
jgi:26-hydroxylase